MQLMTDIQKAEKDTDIEPTEAQKLAGNYKMGRVLVNGLPLVIENPRGSYRSGVGKDGRPWRNFMQYSYGYIDKKMGIAADGDGFDIFLGVAPESQDVFVINQIDPDTGKFDEVKIMLGFESAPKAKLAYKNSYHRDWNGFKSMVYCTLDQLKWWLKYGNNKAPMRKEHLPFDERNSAMNEIVWDSTTDIATLVYSLRHDDKDGLLLDAVTVTDVMEDADGEMALDALVVPLNKLQRKMEQMQMVMNAAGQNVKPVALTVTPPFKQRGTTNVAAIYELSDGQSISVFFHNPDSTPNKLTPDDEMVSWKWLLNKKDVTIVVAPEQGKDLNPREVARRIMRIAEKNSARFQQANVKRGERLATIESLKASNEAKEAALAALDAEIESLEGQASEKQSFDVRDKKIDAATDFAIEQVPAAKQYGVMTAAMVDGEFTLVTNYTIDDQIILGELEMAALQYAKLYNKEELPSIKPSPAVLQEGQQAENPAMVDAPKTDSKWNAYVKQDFKGFSLEYTADRGGKWIVTDKTTGEQRDDLGRRTLKETQRAIELANELVQEQAAQEPTPAEKVDVAYNFKTATKGFKELVAESVGLDDYSAFLSAKTIDNAVNERGGSVAWDADDGSAIGTIFKDGEIIGRADVGGGDGKSIVLVGLTGDKRVTFPSGNDVFRSEDTNTLTDYVGYLFDGLARPEPEKSGEGSLFTEDEIRARAQQAVEEAGKPADEILADTSYLQSVIDGTADMYAEDIADRLEKIGTDYAGDEDMMALFEQAAQSYSDFMIAEAKKALA